MERENNHRRRIRGATKGTFEAVRGVVEPARIFTPALNYGQTGERALLRRRYIWDSHKNAI